MGKLEMKKQASLFLLVLIASATCSGQDTAQKRILFLGNSVWDYKGGVHQPFLGFCKAAGLDVQAVSQMKRRDNSHGIEFLDYGRIPLNLPEVARSEEIISIIREGDFDHVVLEARRSGYLLPAWVERPDVRGDSIPYDQNLDALGEIHRAIVESGAQTILYMHPGLHTLPDIKLPVAQVYSRFHSALENMEIGGKKHRVILVPAALLWLDAVRRFGVENWYANPGHGNALARYASGCLLYTCLTGNDPRNNDFRELPKSWETANEAPALRASPEDAEWIKNQVWLYYSTGPR